MKLIGLVLFGGAVLWAQAPTVTKVEPPGWWTGSTINPVRLLVRGTNLTGATLSGDLKTSHVTVNAKGTYLFADVRIPRGARAGAHPFTVRTSAGSAEAAFAVTEPLQKDGRFAGFSPDDVIYLIMPDRFANGDPANDDPAISKGLFDPSKPRFYHGGDFRGIQDHLGYLKDLGVTAIWINPWYDNANHLNQRELGEGHPVTDYHGYGIVDFYGVEEHFGTLGELQALVNAAHAQGIKVIQDEVANHTGPYHPWVDEPPSPGWFHGTAERHTNETWQLWPLIDPHATTELKAQTLNGWFADILPDLNQDDPECARYLIQNTLWWIGMTGLDAIRMDTLPYVPRSFWKEWMAAIQREFPKVNVLGEVFDRDPAIPAYFQDGPLSVFDFPDFFAVRDTIIHGKPLRDLATVLAHDELYAEPELLGTFIDNHDVVRVMTEPGATVEKLKLAFTWLLTMRGVPTIYYGDEIAMRGGADPDNRRDFPVAAFREAGRTAEQQEVFAHVQALTHLRAATPALREGKTVTLCASEQQWVYARVMSGKSGEMAVVEMNNADTAAAIQCDAPGGTWKTVMGEGRRGEAIAAHGARISVMKTH